MNKKRLLLTQKLKKSKLYCFTPDKFAGNRKILDIVKKEIAGGADIIQLREKRLSHRDLLKLALKIREITLKTDTLFIVNDFIDIAYFSDADGVHLGQDDIPYTYARELLRDKLIGISTHTLNQYKKAQEYDVDYTAIGPIYPTSSKDIPDKPVGVNQLKKILKYKKKPTVIIGGIKLDNLHIFKDMDIDIVAIITDIILANDIKKRTFLIKTFLN